MKLLNNILIIGTTPLPIGGVSIHVKRLTDFLKINNINFEIYDYKRESFRRGFIKLIYSNIVHIHVSNKIFRLLLTLVSFLLRKPLIISFHGNYNFKNILDKLSVRLSSNIIVLNQFTYQSALDLFPNSKKIRLISSFIPPDIVAEKISNEYSSKIDDLKKYYKIVACTNAHDYVVDNLGQDLYGIDFLLKIFSSRNFDALVVSDPSGSLKTIYAEYLTNKNILFISEPQPFIDVIIKSNVFIRATSSDGDSLSVKESLYFNVPVIASDCVDRPKGCIIFETRNEDSLIKCLDRNLFISELENISKGPEDILHLYRSFFN